MLVTARRSSGILAPVVDPRVAWLPGELGPFGPQREMFSSYPPVQIEQQQYEQQRSEQNQMEAIRRSAMQIPYAIFFVGGAMLGILVAMAIVISFRGVPQTKLSSPTTAPMQIAGPL